MKGKRNLKATIQINTAAFEKDLLEIKEDISNINEKLQKLVLNFEIKM